MKPTTRYLITSLRGVMHTQLLLTVARIILVVGLISSNLTPSTLSIIDSANAQTQDEQNFGDDNARVSVPVTSSRYSAVAGETPQPPCNLSSTPLPLTTYNGISHARLVDPKTDEHFIAGTNGCFDQYRGKAELVNSRLTFNLAIDRFYSTFLSSPGSINTDGTLSTTARDQLVSRKLLPATVAITITAFDVDYNGAPKSNNCVETDYIFINDKQILDSDGKPARLTGADGQWSTWVGSFPVEWLKFPSSPGTVTGNNATAPNPTINQIAVEVDHDDCAPKTQGRYKWATEIDWINLDILAHIRPIVFVHGWTGDNATFNKFRDLAINTYLIPAESLDVRISFPTGFGSDLIHATVPILIKKVRQQLIVNGVDRVNLFVHSKGGRDARTALEDPSFVSQVDGLTTISTPHHGTNEPYVYLRSRCKPYDGSLRYEACRNSAYELTIDETRNYNFSPSCVLDSIPYIGPEHYKNCVPQWTKAQNVDYRSLTGDFIDVSPRTSTYPWKSDQLNRPDPQPFPKTTNVDAQYAYAHFNITEQSTVMDCAKDLIYKRYGYKGILFCGYSIIFNSAPASLPASQPIWMDGLTPYPSILQQDISIPANSTRSIALPSDGSSLIASVVSDVPATFTLVNPAGQTITPAIAASDPTITYTEQLNDGFGNGQLYQYVIQSPSVGVWYCKIDTTTAANVGVFGNVDSSTRLAYTTSAQQYRPGDVMTINAGLTTGSTLVAGTVITGTFVQGNSSTSTQLAFYDDGTHGDTTANDNYYTAQLTTPTFTGFGAITIYAKKGTIVRTTKTVIRVGAQTVQLQGISGISTTDTNTNGLFDTLNITATLNVLTSGHFKVLGTLVDSSGQTVATASYSTRNSGSGMLSTGTRSIILSFDGKVIRAAGKNGPYKLTNVSVHDNTTIDLEQVRADNVYTTIAYQANQFEGPFLQINGGSEQPVDTNGNGLYDQLNINVQFNMLRPGTYGWNGQLVDQQGRDLGWASGSGILNNQTPLSLTFSGVNIWKNSKPGPYTLTGLSVYQTSGVTNGYTVTASFGNVYRTTAYNVNQFENDGCSPGATLNNLRQTEQPSSSTLLPAASSDHNFSVFLPVVAKDINNSALASNGDQTYGGNLPLAFIPNVGQTGSNVRYTVQGGDGTFFFTSGEAVLALPHVSSSPNSAIPEPSPTAPPVATVMPTIQPAAIAATIVPEQPSTGTLLDAVVRLRYDGANNGTVMEAGNPLPGVVNYLRGSSSSQWHTNISTYGTITYPQLYPGVSVVYGGTEGQLKRTYLVAAGTNPNTIRWRYVGASSVQVDSTTGDLVVTLPNLNPTAPSRTLIEHAPVAWQFLQNEVRTPVAAAYTVAPDGSVGFILGNYNTARDLVIDPVLTYATELGGTASDYGTAITLTPSCQAVITGHTLSTSFPTELPVQNARAGDDDVFITKLSTDGATVLYSTYLGGTGADVSYGIALDTAGDVAVVGDTDSTDFPTQNALRASFGGGTCGSQPCKDAFVASLSPYGDSVRYSTYLGGNLEDRGRGIAVDGAGNLYVTGFTAGNFPITTASAYASSYGGGSFDAFVTKLNPALTGNASLLYSTYLGGSGTDGGYGIGMDGNGYVVVAGRTASSGFPTKNARQSTKSGNADAFVAQINPSASGNASLRYSTFLGGSGDDEAFAVAVTSTGLAAVTGYTKSTNFPTVTPKQSGNAGGSDVFIAQVNPSLSGSGSLTYSSYYGGSIDDQGQSIAIDSNGVIAVAGWTQSNSFPTANAVDSTFGGGTCNSQPCMDGFAFNLNLVNNQMQYSTYIGGNNDDVAYGIAVDATGAAYMTGYTRSSDFVTTATAGPLGSVDAFVVKIK